jgi:protocatechuate 3,4-dioxygenase beta subunit
MRNDESKTLQGLSRRRLLSLLGAGGVAALAGLPARPSRAEPAQAVPACVVTPEQTEGPYFVDERLNRADVRSDPTDGSVKAGASLVLTLRVFKVGSHGCTPLTGAIVDIWHCDALGVYSDARDSHFDTVGKKFLRGYQVTDANGVVRFTTVYPGWYPGRAVHIHFKVRSGRAAARGYEFTSQLYFDDALTDRVHAQAPYAGRTGQRLRNSGDGIFQHGGVHLLLRPSASGQGYAANFDIGLKMA